MHDKVGCNNPINNTFNTTVWHNILRSIVEIIIIYKFIKIHQSTFGTKIFESNIYILLKIRMIISMIC